MREIQHNETFSGSNETRSIALITAGATLELQLDCDGTFVTMGTYADNKAIDIDLKSGMTWRVSMSDGGASAKAYISNKR